MKFVQAYAPKDMGEALERIEELEQRVADWVANYSDLMGRREAQLKKARRDALDESVKLLLAQAKMWQREAQGASTEWEWTRANACADECEALAARIRALAEPGGEGKV